MFFSRVRESLCSLRVCVCVHVRVCTRFMCLLCSGLYAVHKVHILPELIMEGGKLTWPECWTVVFGR